MLMVILQLRVAFAVPNLGAKVLVPDTSSGQQFIGNSVSGSIYEKLGIGYIATVLPTVTTAISGTCIDSEKTQNILRTAELLVIETVYASTTYRLAEGNLAHSHGDTWYQSDMRDESF